MRNEDIYQIWRPESSPWSRWVKPVVFAFLHPEDYVRNEPVQDWQVAFDTNTSVIVDLPGAEGISVGIAMARAGYRPILLYNACPTATSGYESPEFLSIRDFRPVDLPAVVDMSSILSGICATTKVLASLTLPAQAPPAFLLDSNRHGLGLSYGPGRFDNRSFVTLSDFPSAEYFRHHGISNVILIQPNVHINADLLQILLRLQRDGMSLAMQAPWRPWVPRPLTVRSPMFIFSAWESLRRKFGYRRDTFPGSFGGVIPPSSS